MVRVRCGALAAIASLCLAARAGEVGSRRMLWAHYVPWNAPENRALVVARHANFPVGDVPATVHGARRDEVLRAMEEGIDGFFLDAVFHGDRDVAFADQRAWLEAATGTAFQVGLCVDWSPKPSVDGFKEALLKALRTNATHPNYPKADGKAVVMTYTFAGLGVEGWKAVRRHVAEAGFPIYLIANLEDGYQRFRPERFAEYVSVIEAVYQFGYPGLSGTKVAELYAVSSRKCAELGLRFLPCLWPGYYGAWLNGRNDSYHPYCGFDMLHDTFTAARDVRPVWTHLTTWNDYDETALEPRVESPASRAIVRGYADALKGLPPSAERTDVAFAYHREEYPGTLIRIEAMRLPSRETGPAEVAGFLLDRAGARVYRLNRRVLSNAWDRTEWLVPSAQLVRSPHLTPEVALRSAKGVRRARLQPLFFVAPWLEDPETIRLSFADRAPVDGRLELTWADGCYRAKTSFAAPVAVKRAILFVDNRPVGQFDPAHQDPETVNAFSIAGTDTITIRPALGGRILQARRKYPPRPDSLVWSATQLVSRATEKWTTLSLLATGGTNLTILGNACLQTGLDLTLYDRAPIRARTGMLTFRTAAPRPRTEAAAWVRYELVDGTAAESPVVYPFSEGEKARTAVILETSVTLEKTSGACGRPGNREFLTAADDLPVTSNRLVRVPVASEIARRRFWTKPPARLPAHTWPVGACRIAFGLKSPVETGGKDGKDAPLIVRNGWQDGFSFYRTAEGKLKVVRNAFPYDRENRTFVSSVALPQSGTCRIELVYDWNRVRVTADGVTVIDGAVPPVRVYGNGTATVAPDVCDLEIGLQTCL